MDDLTKRIEELKQTSHCANCGILHPKIIKMEVNDKGGVTECCQEAVCKSTIFYRFGNPKISVTACCWAMAELNFKAQGVDILKLDGIRRFEE